MLPQCDVRSVRVPTHARRVYVESAVSIVRRRTCGKLLSHLFAVCQLRPKGLVAQLLLLEVVESARDRSSEVLLDGRVQNLSLCLCSA